MWRNVDLNVAYSRLQVAFKGFLNSNLGVLIVNLLLAEVAFMVCRVVFLLWGKALFSLSEFFVDPKNE